MPILCPRSHSVHASLLTVAQAAELTNLCPNTIRALTDSGKVQTARTLGNHRRIIRSSLLAALGLSEPEKSSNGGKLVIYGRVSGRKQAAPNGEGQSDLSRQTERLRSYCVEHYGKVPDAEYVECGSGLSDSRPKFLSLVKAIVSGEIGIVVVMYEDRLARFGTNLFKAICQQTGTRLVVVEDVNKEKSYEEELCEDLMMVTHVYSSRHYGRRGAEATRVHFTDEAKQRIRELFGQGYGATAIVRTLAEEGLKCPKGRAYREAVVRRFLLQLVSRKAEANEGDQIALFVSQQCQTGPNLRVWSDELHAAYSRWAEARGIAVPDRRPFADRLKSMGFVNYKSTNTRRRWSGLRLVNQLSN